MSSDNVDDSPSREELLRLIAELRAENQRLRDEIRREERDRHETPPHYL
jgi:hypothetical protein